MVRLKNRYLLVDILYPDPTTWPTTKSKPLNPQSAHLSIHSPTSDALTPGLLAKMIREEVAEMYGDWGVGKLGGASATGVNTIIRVPRAAFRLVWSALTYMSHVPATGGDAGARRPNGGRERACVFRVLRVSGTMRKAEEEAISKARREIVRVRGVEEEGVLGDLLGGEVKGSIVPVPVSGGVMDESEDEGMVF
ncbi:hypothetical protein N7526_001526 [Penicillium atrosanguineum]|nr:hypothetical protein N7526_001526 [Penicillium atrosanguineum]